MRRKFSHECSMVMDCVMAELRVWKSGWWWILLCSSWWSWCWLSSGFLLRSDGNCICLKSNYYKVKRFPNLRQYNTHCTYTHHCRMRDKCSMFSSPKFKNLIFNVVFNAELYCTIRILCFRRSIIDLLWPSRAQLGHSRSAMAQRLHKIMMVPLNKALKRL